MADPQDVNPLANLPKLPRGPVYRGRKPGSPGRYKQGPARQMAGEILGNPLYKERLLERAIKGELHPSLERTLWYYKYGRPYIPMQVDIEHRDSTPDPNAPVNLDELISRAAELVRVITELRKVVDITPESAETVR